VVQNPLLVVSEWPFTYRLILKSAPLIEALEKMLRRATKGKWGVLDIVGIPTIRLFIPGRRTGVVRATTLQCISGGDGLFVVGSNWARVSHPAWTANLQAVKRVTARRQQVEYEAAIREVEGPERGEAWTSIVRTWPNYELAQRMAADRPFRIFTLTGPPRPPTEP
jgi:deazaflavin-dependent oxidoreductase (nitroreductase family)